MPGVERLSINLATLGRDVDLGAAVGLCARLGIRAVAPWRGQVRAAGLKEAARLLRNDGMRVTGLCRAGDFTAEDGPERRRRRDDNRRAIEEAATIGAGCLVLACGGLPARSKDLAGARHMVEDGIASILDDAMAAGVPLGIEPLHPMHAADASVVTTLRQALDLCDGLGSDGVGVVLDLHQCWWDPELEAQVGRAGAGKRLLGLHLADWLVPTRHMSEDRGMPGDGVIDIPRLRRLAVDAGYSGLDEFEVASRDWWGREPGGVLRACVERHESAC